MTEFSTEIPTKILIALHEGSRGKKEIANLFGMTMAKMRKEIEALEKFLTYELIENWKEMTFTKNGNSYVAFISQQMIEKLGAEEPVAFMPLEQIKNTEWVDKQIELEQLSPGTKTYAVGGNGVIALHQPEDEMLKSKVMVQAQGRMPTVYELMSAGQLMPEGTPIAFIPDSANDGTMTIIDLRDNIKETFKYALCFLAETMGGIAIPVNDLLAVQGSDKQLHIYQDGDLVRFELNDPS